MPPAGMNLGPIFQNASWSDVLGFFAGGLCVFLAIVLLHARVVPSGVGGRLGLVALATGGLLAIAVGVGVAFEAAGAEPAGWLARFGAAWAWGVGLVGFGSAAGAFKQGDPPARRDRPGYADLPGPTARKERRSRRPKGRR
jgi:hypothetical protein